MTLHVVFKRILFFAFTTCSFNASCEWVTIENFRVWSNTYETDTIRVDIRNGPALTNPSLCTDPDSYMVSASLDNESKTRIYSSLLAAAMANRPITLWVTGCERSRPAILNTLVG